MMHGGLCSKSREIQMESLVAISEICPHGRKYSRVHIPFFFQRVNIPEQLLPKNYEQTNMLSVKKDSAKYPCQ